VRAASHDKRSSIVRTDPAPASGRGKTSVTAALARQTAREGKRVRVFEAGPDFINPRAAAALFRP